MALQVFYFQSYYNGLNFSSTYETLLNYYFYNITREHD